MTLLIFDLDGTLVDSSATLINGINYVRSKVGLPPMDGEEIMHGIMTPGIHMSEYFYGVDGIDSSYEQLFKEYYSANHDKELRLYDGVEEMLETFEKKRYTLALATNGYRDSTLEALKHLKIERFFDSIVCYDDVENGKPAPDMLLLLLQKYGLNALDTLFIGDSQRDKLAAKAANIEFLQVDFGQNNKNVFTEPQELVKEIEKRSNNV